MIIANPHLSMDDMDGFIVEIPWEYGWWLGNTGWWYTYPSETYEFVS